MRLRISCRWPREPQSQWTGRRRKIMAKPPPTWTASRRILITNTRWLRPFTRRIRSKRIRFQTQRSRLSGKAWKTNGMISIRSIRNSPISRLLIPLASKQENKFMKKNFPKSKATLRSSIKTIFLLNDINPYFYLIALKTLSLIDRWVKNNKLNIKELK